MACIYCDNARINPCDELDDSNDLSYCSVGSACNDLRFMIRAGGGLPVAILLEKYYKNDGWYKVGIFYPRFCPNCGRRLDEYDNDERVMRLKDAGR